MLTNKTFKVFRPQHLYEESTYSALMSRALSQANGNSILVMGMTVVVRRVANQLSKSVTSIDINEDAIQLLTPAIDKKHNEKIIRANWLELPDVYGKKADVIAGDGVFCTMQSMSDSISLLKCLKNTLTENGAIVLRVMIVPKTFTIRGMAYNEILEKYRGKEFSGPEFGFAMRLWGFLDESYNPDTYMLDCGVAFARCQEMVKIGAMPAEDFEVMKKTYYTGENFVPPIDVWEDMLHKAGFAFESTTLKGKHWFRYFPLYYCTHRE